MLVAVLYLIYISLGLPDSLLGSGWPVMKVEFGVPSSYAGYVFMTIAFMTIISALMSPMLIKKVHTKWIIVVSIFFTIVGILGFSFSRHYAMLLFLAVPYGLGAGAIDASVNHYIANNYSGSVMSFLHCFYGVGAIISPNIMALALTKATWHEGYRWTSFIQMGIMFVCVISLPLWNKNKVAVSEEKEESATIKETLRVPGVILTLIAFFSYCSGEATCFLWTSSYFAGTRPFLSDSMIASFGMLVFFGLMLGRLISGFITNRFGDRKMIRFGIILEVIGISLLFVKNAPYQLCVAAFLLIGTGMGPVFPSIQHMAPINFSKKYSAAVIGMQMASAYVGTSFMPMVFGHIQQHIGIGIMPFYLLLFAVMNFTFLELAYIIIKKMRSEGSDFA